MTGGLIQLAAYGAEDLYITSNPEVTFFKTVFRRHTNFSMEAIPQSFNGIADFGKKVSCTISRNGDLVTKMYIIAQLPSVSCAQMQAFAWTRHVGYALIKNIEIEIGGQLIDKHYSEWLYIWSELSKKPGHTNGLNNMVGHSPELYRDKYDQETILSRTLYIPLHFWFCNEPGVALPLIALQYHEVKINIEFRDKTDLYNSTKYTYIDGSSTTAPLLQNINTIKYIENSDLTLDENNPIATPGSLVSSNLYVDYIFLDVEERKKFSQASHEYIITQVQFSGDETVNSTNSSIKINFNHPIKELIWVVHGARQEYVKQWFNFTNNPYSNAASTDENPGLDIGNSYTGKSDSGKSATGKSAKKKEKLFFFFFGQGS